MSTRTRGLLLFAPGLLLLAASLLADVIGIGGMPGIFGWKQVLGTALGITLMVVGAYIARGVSTSA
jgi:hypothetical protein